MTFVFFLTGEVVGGNELVIRSLMVRLNALGHRAIAIVAVWNESPFPGMLSAAGIEHHEVRLGRLYLRNYNWTRGTLYELPEAVRTIRAVVAEAKPAWVIMSEAQLLLLCSHIIPEPRRALYMHTEPDWMMRNPVLGRIVARRVEHVVCVSQYVARCVMRSPLRRARVSVVPNGTVVAGEPPRAAATSPVRLAIVGRVSEQKQHLTLVRAMALLKARLPARSFCLDIVGSVDDGHVRLVEAEIARLGVAGLVRFVGFVAQPDRIYDCADIVVAPGLGEGFGLTLVEAGARGLPVVAARSGGFPEIVIDQMTGVLFEPENAEALALALAPLILDADLRRQLGEAARRRVRTEFTLDGMADRFLGAIGGA